jgi:hypothetical protein
MIDALVAVLVYLLMQFNAPTECCIGRPVEVPSASHTADVIDAPIVTVSLDAVLVDGSPAGDARATSDGVQRVEGLTNILKAKRELWKETHPNKAFPGAVLLEIDRRTSAAVVKSILRTAALAGYPNESFIVHRVPDQVRPSDRGAP